MFATSPAGFPSSSPEERLMYVWSQCAQSCRYPVEQTAEFQELPDNKLCGHVRQVMTISGIVLLVEAMRSKLCLAIGNWLHEMAISLTLST